MTVGLALAIAGVARSDPGPGTTGRGLAVSILLAVASAAWLLWAWNRTPERWAPALLGVFAITGGLLTAAAPNGPSSAFAFVAVVSAGVRFAGAPAFAIYLLAALSVTVGAIAWDVAATGAAAYVAGLLAGLFAGIGRRTSLLRAEEAELLLAQTQRSREEQVRAAALDERARIAREIHDVLAHSLAGLTIDLEATRMLVERGADTEQILARVDRAHALARDGLHETRRAIEALRGDAVGVRDQLEALVAEFRDGTGAEIELQVDGAIDDLPADVELALVRVTQESLTNARKHAPGSAVQVTLERTAHAVRLRVVDTPPAEVGAVVSSAGVPDDHDLAASGGGYGLKGMRERAELLGGMLTAERDGRRWQVDLVIPVARVPA
jgi:signal transduction histidine kinase